MVGVGEVGACPPPALLPTGPLANGAIAGVDVPVGGRAGEEFGDEPGGNEPHLGLQMICKPVEIRSSV